MVVVSAAVGWKFDSTGLTSMPGVLFSGGSTSRYRGRTCSCSQPSSGRSLYTPCFKIVHTCNCMCVHVCI